MNGFDCISHEIAFSFITQTVTDTFNVLSLLFPYYGFSTVSWITYFELNIPYSNAQTSFITYSVYVERISIIITHIFHLYLWGWVTLKQIILWGWATGNNWVEGGGPSKVLWRHSHFHQPTLPGKKWTVPNGVKRTHWWSDRPRGGRCCTLL
jgi:hypothetical protein